MNTSTLALMCGGVVPPEQARAMAASSDTMRLTLMCLGLVPLPLYPVVTVKLAAAGDTNQVDRTKIAHQRREAICAFIAAADKPVTKHDIAEEFGVPWTTAHADLYKLRDKGRIVPITDESHRLLGFGVMK